MQLTFCVSLLHFVEFSFVLIRSTISFKHQAWLTHILLWCQRPHIVMRVSIASELLSHKSAKVLSSLSSYMIFGKLFFSKETFFINFYLNFF